MKRFLRYIPVFLVCLILAVSPLLMSVDASAYSAGTSSGSLVSGYYDPAAPDGDIFMGDNFVYCPGTAFSSDLVLPTDDLSGFSATCVLSVGDGSVPVPCSVVLQDSSYFIVAALPELSAVVGAYIPVSSSDASAGLYLCTNLDPSDPTLVYCSSLSLSYCAASAEAPDGNPVVSNGVYQSIFDLIHTHIYGGVELSADMNLVCTLLATVACVFVFALPFLVVWFVIKLIGGR